MRVAFIHDWLLGMRGGEKVLEGACGLFPQAEIYTLFYKPERVSGLINRRKIRASCLQRLPWVHRYYRYLLPLMPRAIERFDLSGYDLLLSFSHCVAKGAGMKARGERSPLHICYCFTPMRYIYYQFDNYFPEGSRTWIKKATERLRPYLIRWDQEAAKSVDHFIACSENVRARIRKTYGRDAHVIYPPVDTDFFDVAPGGRRASRPYYLAAGALVPYKRIDIAIQACRMLNVPLKVVGVGAEEGRLKKLAVGAPVEFLGWQPQEALRELYRGCEALLFPQEEDFGIAAVEAMACGRPVIAYEAGGALETVEEGRTGVFFDAQTPEALAGAIARARSVSFDPALIRESAGRFDQKNFTESLSGFIAAVAPGGVARKTRVMKETRDLYDPSGS